MIHEAEIAQTMFNCDFWIKNGLGINPPFRKVRPCLLKILSDSINTNHKKRNRLLIAEIILGRVPNEEEKMLILKTTISNENFIIWLRLQYELEKLVKKCRYCH